MKFTCNLENLKTIASDVSLAITFKSSTIPILEGILLNCENNTLTLTGYDLSLGIVKSLKVNQIEKGSVVLKAQLFVEILRKLNEETLTISVDENLTTTITTKTTKYKIAGIKPDSFPKLPSIENDDTITIKDTVLKNAIFKTLFAVSINNTQNPILCGSLFSIKENILTIVSVDGYRIGISNNQLLAKSKPYSFVISSKSLNEILKLLKDNEEKTTTIKISDNHVVFSIDGYYIITRLLQGSFLDYNSAISETFKTTVEINPLILQQSIQKVSVIITQKISVIMEILENKVNLYCESTLGKVKDTIMAKTNGDQLEKIAFNNKFMLDALKHCQTEKIIIGFNGPVMPIIIKPLKGEDFLYLILPIRLR